MCATCQQYCLTFKFGCALACISDVMHTCWAQGMLCMAQARNIAHALLSTASAIRTTMYIWVSISCQGHASMTCCIH